MKSDLDAIMQANNIDVLLVTGAAQHNPAMVYLTGGGHITNADYIKKRGEDPVLFHTSMERDEAARTGISTCNYERYPYSELLAEAGDRSLVPAVLYCHMLKDLGITQGRVALYGEAELSSALPLFSELQRRLPGISLVGDPQNRILGAAMVTKDGAEVERIRRMGGITTEVVGMVADYLTTRPVCGDMLIGPEDDPLTIGQVKGLINLWLAERGAENPEGTIFAIGRDAGVPHSTGAAGDVLRLGQSIVFDIFPCEAGGGYFYDFTRSWCLGHAPVEVLAAYEHVRYVFETIQSEMKPHVPMSEYNRRACELFEGFGYPTLRVNPETEVGFVHGLGHGLGLRVHEHPAHHATGLPEDNLTPGVVVTVEPGLYYPDKGFGVRLEDTLYACQDGTFDVLAEYPLDLVLPMKKQGMSVR